MSEPKRRRSRNGCFTCKIRKVRCNNADQTSILARSANKPCNNCERLGLECRWSAPAAGEQYTRPPKRRRQTAQRRSPPSVVIDHPESIPNGAAGLSSSGTGYHAIDAPQAASAEGVQFSPQLDFSDPVLAAHLNDWEMDLALESLDFMLPDAHYSMTSDPAYVNLPSNKQAPGYDTSSLEATWNLESLSNGRFSRLSASITDENSHLIQHYLHALQGYAKVSDHPRDPNLFLSAFSASLSFQPLFYAILAFSSAHLAMNDPSFTDQAEMYDRMSAECFETFRLAPHISVEGLLCAIFVRIKKIHITGSSTDRFLNLMQIAADILSSDQGHEYLNSRSSAFGRRIITRLAVLDARSAAYRLGGGQFVRRVRDLPSLSDMFSTIVRIDPAAEGIMCLFQVSRLRMQVAELELRIHEQLSAETISAPPVRLEEVTSLYVSLEAHIRAWEVSMKDGIDFDHVASLPDEITLDAVSYRDYTVLSALHSTKLYLHLVFPLSNYPTSHSVSAILHCELMIQKDTSRANSPAALMPASLFLAGVFATDLIHRDWVLSHLKQGERWGTYIRKVGDLLKGIVRTRLQGLPVDIHGAMESTTGPFVI